MLYGLCTDVGRMREKNEDFILADHEAGIFIVADGMGGYKGGEIASREAALFLLSYLKHKVLPLQTLTERKQGIEIAMTLANGHIAQIASKDKRLAGMGTTAVVALVEEGSALIGHVGDSRAYFIAQDEIRQLTKDHSLVQELVDHGTITAAEAETHPKRHVVTQALGSETPVAPAVSAFKVTRPGTLLLCTDGLSGLVDPRDIQRLVLESADLQDAARDLVNLANVNGGRDNISVILVACQKIDQDE